MPEQERQSPRCKVGGAGEEVAIRFKAEIVRVSTRADFGVRLTLDLPEKESKALQELIEVFRAGAVLQIAAVPVLMAVDGK